MLSTQKTQGWEYSHPSTVSCMEGVPKKIVPVSHEFLLKSNNYLKVITTNPLQLNINKKKVFSRKSKKLLRKVALFHLLARLLHVCGGLVVAALPVSWDIILVKCYSSPSSSHRYVGGRGRVCYQAFLIIMDLSLIVRQNTKVVVSCRLVAVWNLLMVNFPLCYVRNHSSVCALRLSPVHDFVISDIGHLEIFQMLVHFII